MKLILACLVAGSLASSLQRNFWWRHAASCSCPTNVSLCFVLFVGMEGSVDGQLGQLLPWILWQHFCALQNTHLVCAFEGGGNVGVEGGSRCRKRAVTC